MGGIVVSSVFFSRSGRIKIVLPEKNGNWGETYEEASYDHHQSDH